MDIQYALESYCYRKVRPGLWVKPFGYTLYSFLERTGEWGVWFASPSGEPLCWTREELDPALEGRAFLEQLKALEVWSGRTFWNPSSFEINRTR